MQWIDVTRVANKYNLSRGYAIFHMKNFEKTGVFMHVKYKTEGDYFAAVKAEEERPKGLTEEELEEFFRDLLAVKPV